MSSCCLKVGLTPRWAPHSLSQIIATLKSQASDHPYKLGLVMGIHKDIQISQQLTLSCGLFHSAWYCCGNEQWSRLHAPSYWSLCSMESWRQWDSTQLPGGHYNPVPEHANLLDNGRQPQHNYMQQQKSLRWSRGPYPISLLLKGSQWTWHLVWLSGEELTGWLDKPRLR